MENKNSFKLQHVLLFESFFKRLPQINISEPTFSSDISINIDTNVNDNILSISLTLNYRAGIDKETNEIEAKVLMMGIFECPTETDNQLSVETFSKINAPAILFPFVREHLASVSMKAGMNPILLPPVNFVKLASN